MFLKYADSLCWNRWFISGVFYSAVFRMEKGGLTLYVYHLFGRCFFYFVSYGGGCFDFMRAPYFSGRCFFCFVGPTVSAGPCILSRSCNFTLAYSCSSMGGLIALRCTVTV